MQIAYLDAFAGVAGDMWVGALLDLGLELEALRAAVASMGLSGVELRAEATTRAGLRGVKFHVDVPATPHPVHRGLAEVVEVVSRAEVPEVVRERIVATFGRLAEAEAAVHDRPLDAVHFHEVGAEDTIVDVVCACLGVHLLGLERIYCSRVTTGGGTVECAHGELPVPAPGTMALLAGVPVRRGAVDGERTTPTGAALLRELVDGFETDIEWTPERTGYGAGTRDDDGHPNLLRIAVGTAGDTIPAGSAIELACNLDTATGETLAYLVDGALARGALDAWVVPAQMKKGRPGNVLSALVEDGSREPVVRFLLEESSTLGVRAHRVRRELLARWGETAATRWGPVRFKCARLPSGVVVRRPEDDELERLAEQTGLGRRELLASLGERHGDS